MNETKVPHATRPEDISCDFYTEVCREARLIGDGTVMTAMTAKPIGTGQMSYSYRVTPVWSGGAGPETFVVKLPSDDEGSRGAGRDLGSYNIEVSFYREFAPKLQIRTPACYYAAIDPDMEHFVLVLEDVAPAAQGDQMAGCSLEQARTAIREVTKLHAPFLNDPILKERDWLNRNKGNEALFRPMLKEFYKGFRERYAGKIEEDILEMGQRYFDRMDDLKEDTSGLFSLSHTDYRLDNMLFATAEGGPEIVVVDWQTVGCGSPLSDVSYFIGAGLHVEDRRRHEEELVRLYYETMLEAGVPDFGWETCWTLYRKNAFAGLVMAVMASQLVVRTERGDEMFRTMARRHGQQILDLDSEQLV